MGSNFSFISGWLFLRAVTFQSKPSFFCLFFAVTVLNSHLLWHVGSLAFLHRSHQFDLGGSVAGSLKHGGMISIQDHLRRLF